MALRAAAQATSGQSTGHPASSVRAAAQKRQRAVQGAAEARPAKVASVGTPAHSEGLLQRVFERPTAAAVAVSRSGEPQGYVVNACFMREMHARMQRLQAENAALRGAAGPPGAPAIGLPSIAGALGSGPGLLPPLAATDIAPHATSDALPRRRSKRTRA